MKLRVEKNWKESEEIGKNLRESKRIYRAFIKDSKGVVGHGFQKFRFAEIIASFLSSHLSLMKFVTCHLKSSFLLF